MAEVVDRLGDELRCLRLALVLQRVGDAVELTGRVQSRQYIKLIEGEPVEKTAYEVSASEIRLASAARSAVGAL